MAKSKRKSLDVPGPSREKQHKQDADNSKDQTIFGTFITKAGIRLKTKIKPNEILVDQTIFQKNIRSAIKKESDSQQTIKDFVEALVDYFDDQVRFRMALMPTITSVDADESSRGGVQDSMVKILLGVDLLQPGIMNALLEKLVVFSEDDEPVFDDSGRVNMARLIMNQFRWLNKIVNSKELLTKMFEILSVSCQSVQREIIACIPEVIEDTQHSEVARQLRDLVIKQSELTVPILDAMSNLNLKQDVLSEVRSSVVTTLPLVALEDMPIIVKFMLQTIDTNDALEVVSELRKHLDFEFSFPPELSSTPHHLRRSSGNQECDRGCEILTVDAIRSAIRFQRAVAEAWLKAIARVKSASEHKVIDIFVLVIMHANNHKKPVESLFRIKIRSGQFTEVLLQAAFGSHAEVLREYFPNILAISEILLRSPEPAVCFFACTMYRLAFEAFDDYGRQEIVGNLVTHIGSGLAGEIDASLDIMVALMDKCSEKLERFLIFIKGILDYVDNLTIAQIRKLYHVITSLSMKHLSEGESIKDDMHIITRKQLTSNVPKYQRMGVIGSLMIVKNLSYYSLTQQTTVDETRVNKGPELSDSLYEEVTSLMCKVRKAVERWPEVAALFMDELATIIRQGHLHPRIEEWVSDKFVGDFQDDFVSDFSKEGENLLPWSAQYGLDEESDDSIAVAILPLAAKAKDTKNKSRLQPKARILSPVTLASHFRLVQMCENREHDGNLEGIDALLGCPLFLPQPLLIEKCATLGKQEKEVLCSSMFYGVNWFREVLNAFSGQSDQEIRSKVLKRITHILEIQKLIEKLLADNSSFVPPPANFASEEAAKAPVHAGTSTAGIGKKPGRGKKRPLDDTDLHKDTLDDTQPNNQDATADSQAIQGNDSKEEPSVKISVDISAYGEFLRELDLEVFSLLGLPSNLSTSTEAGINTQIQPLQLEFLLNDLVKKVDHISLSSANKRRTIFKTKPDSGFANLDQLGHQNAMKTIVKFLPAVCFHLERTQNYFQELYSANDGVIDGPGHNSEESKIISRCFQHLLQALSSILAWNGFLLPENYPLYREALGLIAGRSSSNQTQSQVPTKDLLRVTFEYLLTYASTVPNINAALTLSKLLVHVADKAEDEDLFKLIAVQSQEFLKKEWLNEQGEKEKGAKFNEQLQAILQIFTNNSEDVLKSIEDICHNGLPELIDTDKNGFSSSYPTLTRQSFPVYYRTVLHDIVDHVKTIQPSKQNESEEEKEAKLVKWKSAIGLFNILVNSIKEFDGRANLKTILKFGRQFVDAFLRLAMPMMDRMFIGHKEIVLSLLKIMQQSTRSLQHMCGHSKIMKDITLTNQVPFLKKSLESFVYRVKAMLTVNQCLEAFWLGNLKNRDLKGEEIVSQRTQQEDESDGESIPEEDDESEVEMETESVTSKVDSVDNRRYQEESYSETF